MKLRAATYHRVSTRSQDPTLAREELRRAAEIRGFEIIEEIEETGSGARNDRPGLQRALAMARAGKLDVLLVQRIDRLGRSALDLETNIRELMACGVWFIATAQGLEVKPSGDAMSMLFLRQLSAFAEFERELISERTRAGQARARRKGVRFGRKPVLTVTQVKLARQLRGQGMSWRAVAKKLGAAEATIRRCVKIGHPHETPVRRESASPKTSRQHSTSMTQGEVDDKRT